MTETTLYVALSKSWDSQCYPRVVDFPIKEKMQELKLLARYYRMILAAFEDHADWQSRAGYAYWDYRAGVTLASEIPSGTSEVYAVMSAQPQKITWEGELPYKYRLRMDLLSNAFLSRGEAVSFKREKSASQPDSLFIVVKIPLRRRATQSTA